MTATQQANSAAASTQSDRDTLASPLQAPSKGALDPINLHMQAMNCLARCKALLTVNEPVYLFALKDLASAKQAIEALYALEQKLEG